MMEDRAALSGLLYRRPAVPVLHRRQGRRHRAEDQRDLDGAVQRVEAEQRQGARDQDGEHGQGEDRVRQGRLAHRTLLLIGPVLGYDCSPHAEK
ncbi:hypothetical protein ACFRNJ_22155 [Streptomyces sp. NPDC056721]|uniref:hypothetical protein n=1 Tax=Streptomyces sp. NPDC056721 TaxID=3345923 RepID=UPI003689BE37